MFILTIQDNFTTYSLALPLPNHQAGMKADAFVKKFICIFGSPKGVLTNQGRDCLSYSLKILAKRFRIKHCCTTAFHYQSNGSLERSRRKCLAARWRFNRSKGDSLLHEAWKRAKAALRRGIKKIRLQCWKDLIGEVEKDPWRLAFKIVTKKLVTRRKTPGLDNPDRVKYIVRSLFPHVGSFQSEDRSSCVIQREELFNLEELKREGGRLNANTAPGIDGVPNEILKEVIGAYPEILLGAFNSCLQEGRFFADWKKQSLVLLRKGNKPVGDASSYRPICLLDTIGKLLEKLILQRLRALLVGENGLSKNQFGFRKGRSTVDAIQAVVNIATNARKGTGKRKGFCALISNDIRNAFNTARWNICIEAILRKKVPDYLLRMIDDYLSDRWLIYEGDKWSLKEEMMCGAPQGPRVGPLV